MARNEIRFVVPSNVILIICPICGGARAAPHEACTRFQRKRQLACAAFTHCLWDSGIEDFNEHVRLFTTARSPQEIITICRDMQLTILGSMPRQKIRLVGAPHDSRKALALEHLSEIVDRFEAFSSDELLPDPPLAS